jgi:hypothetical protein
MNIPFIQPAVNAVRQWADLGGNVVQSEPHGGPIRKKRLPFDEQFPRLTSHLSLNDFQRRDLTPRLGFTTLGQNEIDLALSRTPADTEPSNVASVASGVSRAWREEHPTDSDAAAARKLLDGSASLAAIDGKRESARLAAEQAKKEHQEFEKAYHAFRAIPARHEQLTRKVASLEGERIRLNQTDWDAKDKGVV